MKLREYYRVGLPLTAVTFGVFSLLAALWTGNWAYMWFSWPAVTLVLPGTTYLMSRIERWLECRR